MEGLKWTCFLFILIWKILEIKSQCSLNQWEIIPMKIKQMSKHHINQNFHTKFLKFAMSIFVWRAEKSTGRNKSGVLLAFFHLIEFRSLMTSTALIDTWESIYTMVRNMSLFQALTLKDIGHMYPEALTLEHDDEEALRDHCRTLDQSTSKKIIINKQHKEMRRTLSVSMKRSC